MDELVDVLANEFRIPLDGIDVARLWDNACHQHEAWLRTT
jgi:hypothetical protein